MIMLRPYVNGILGTWIRHTFPDGYVFAYVSGPGLYEHYYMRMARVKSPIPLGPFVVYQVGDAVKTLEEAKQQLDEFIIKDYGDIMLSQERYDKLMLLR
jgi:hypothetical protein